MRMLNLALQGGGSHGAFTWGVLDALLDDGRIGFEGLSGTSAGALNAVALASGWATAEAAGRDPREGARETLSACWTRVSSWGSLGNLQQQVLRLLWGGLPQLSPYQANPLGLNPLRDLLVGAIDFDAIAAHREIKVFVCATHVNTGKAVIFTGRRLDASAVLASACLPSVFQAVEIDGEAYWDGGFSANPALSPLTTECRTADLMLVQINPVARQHAPRTTPEIQGRVSELTFNASLLTQMRAIDFINRLVAEGAVSHPGCKAVRVHRIDGGAGMEDFPAATRGSPDAAMIARLFRHGQQAATAWLQKHHGAIGHHGTVDIRRDYLDDTRLDLPVPAASPVRRLPQTGFKPWLARLLRRRSSR